VLLFCTTNIAADCVLLAVSIGAAFGASCCTVAVQSESGKISPRTFSTENFPSGRQFLTKILHLLYVHAC